MIQNINEWNLLEHPSNLQHRDLKQVKEVETLMKEHQIKTDTLTLSREGMTALREQVQGMPGRIDVEQIRQMKEILPKLRINPSDDFLWAMRNDMQDSLNEIKQSRGSYTLDDLITIRMNAYERQYNALQKSYEDGSRDIYVSDGFDENGNLNYRQVTREEDEAYLKKAFDRIAESLEFSAGAQELQWKINQQFGGQKALPVSLPKGYGEKLSGILQRAASDYAKQEKNEDSVSASGLALKYLNEDRGFANAMRTLFSGIRPMPY